jgi:hypothetical protein
MNMSLSTNSDSTLPRLQNTPPASFQLAQAAPGPTDPGSARPTVSSATQSEAARFFEGFAAAENPVAVMIVSLPNNKIAIYGRWVNDFGENTEATSDLLHKDMIDSFKNALKQGIIPIGSVPLGLLISPSPENSRGIPFRTEIPLGLGGLRTDEIGSSYVIRTIDINPDREFNPSSPFREI